MTPEDYLQGDPLGLAVFERVRTCLAAGGPVEVRTSRSQIAFRRRRGFAWIWLPARYLGERGSDIAVLSVALGRRDESPRFKQVVHVAPAHWMHHLEIRDEAEIDDAVVGWLREAAGRAG